MEVAPSPDDHAETLPGGLPSSLGQGVRDLQGLSADIQSVLCQVSAAVSPAMEALNKWSQGVDWESLGKNIQIYQEAIAGIPERSRNSATVAAKRGWYIGPTIGISIIRDVEVVEDGDQLDALFKAHYVENIDAVETFVCEDFPHRVKPLKAAFQAHRERIFELSIPAFLAQADGIFRDRLGKTGELFATRPDRVQNRQESLEKMATNCPAWFRDCILEPLKSPLRSAERVSEWENTPDSLNRNAVLHGIDLDYGTELNSLRVISLIDFLTWILRRKVPVSLNK